MFEIEIEIPRETKKLLDDMPDKTRKGLRKGMKSAIYYAEAEAKKSFGKSGKLKTRTGHLRRSIRSSVRDTYNELIGSLSSDVIYASPHEYGAVIKPKKSNYLKFSVGDAWRIVKSVTIPERPFLTPAIKDNKDKLAEIITNAIVTEFNK